jgi:predicted ATP-dependent endonuclease of OLD family
MKPEMEAIKHFLWLNADRSTLFFAAFVLLVEGPTEVALINKLIHDGRIQDLDCGLYILDCLGKYNIHRFMNLLNQLGIMHSVLHDDDLDKDEHKDINQLIEDSRDGKLTYQVVRIPDKLEAYLGVSSASSPHRKPQHLIYLYEEGAISQSNLDSFSQIVQSCIPGDVKSII